MAKGTHAQGATFSEHELSDPEPPSGHEETFRVQRAMLGGELQSAGTPYSESSESELSSSGLSTASPQELAQTTGSLSSQLEEGEGSSAAMTGGDGQKMTPPPYDEWTVSELQEELRERELPVAGKKAELIARLTEDDQLLEATPENSTEDEFE